MQELSNATHEKILYKPVIIGDSENCIILTFISVVPEINSYFQVFRKYEKNDTGTASL
jgi:hypothetical protein